jgi:stage II sporulation protein R
MNMKRTVLMAFSLMMLMMSWEGQLTSANVMDNGPIPQESIRLRIIANSDSFQDQWLKREVRDALIAQMNTWADDIESFEEAQQVVAANLPVMQQVVDKTVRERGFSYKSVVDFGQVPFPTKLYGSYVYPAGNYEALRVQIGEAKGQNWWCVLFPPLCFIDMSNADAVPAEEVLPEESEAAAVEEENISSVIPLDTQPQATSEAENGRTSEDWQERRQARFEEDIDVDQDQTVPVEDAVTATDMDQPQVPETVEEVAPAPEVEVRFYLLEKLEKLFS